MHGQYGLEMPGKAKGNKKGDLDFILKSFSRSFKDLQNVIFDFYFILCYFLNYIVFFQEFFYSVFFENQPVAKCPYQEKSFGYFCISSGSKSLLLVCLKQEMLEYPAKGMFAL